MLANALDQPSKFREKDCVGINDGSCGTYNSNNQIRFKSWMLESGLCDCSDAYILLCGTTTITGGPNDAAEANKKTGERNKEVIFKNCTPFIECTSKINNTKWIIQKIWILRC